MGLVLVVAVGLTGCGPPSWKQDLSVELGAAKERWSAASADTVSYTVSQTVCGLCDPSTLTDIVPVVWDDGRTSTTAPTDPAAYAPSKLFDLAEDAIEHAADEEDVTLAFDDATGLPTHINLTWDAVDDGDYAFAIEVTGVE